MKAILVLTVMLFAAQAAFSATDIYEIRGTPDFGIYQLDQATGVVTTVYNNYPGGSSATLAQRPSDGMLFYAINATNGQVYKFNPATPGIAPVPLTNTLGAAVPASLRMEFSPGGTLYYLPDTGVLYTINQVTGVATAGPTITGVGSGGDIAFSPSGTLYIVNSSQQLFTASVGGGAAILLGTITFPGGITPATIGLTFDVGGNLRVEAQNPNNLYTVSLATLVASSPVALGGGTTSTGDLGGGNFNVPDPDLSITKTDSVASVYQGGPVSYTIVVTNKTAAFAVTGTVVDNVSANITGVTWTCSASAGSTCAAASGAGNAINTSANLLPSGTATYIVSGTVALGAIGNLVNTATVGVPAFLIEANPGDNSATDTDSITPSADLSITKTDGLANINPGSAVTYTIVVRSAATSGIVANGVIVTDTVPASLSGVTWTCGAATLGATCGAASGSGNAISTTANLPIGSSVTYTVSGTLSVIASGTLTNTATVINAVAGPIDPTDPLRTGAGNNTATDNTPINTIADMTINKAHVGNFTQGQVGATYTLTATNSGTRTTSGTVTVTDTLPVGLTATAINGGASWACTLATLTCTRATTIAAGASAPAITVTVTVAANAPASVTNTATVSGGGQVNTTNDTGTDPTTIVQPDLTITKTHVGNFSQGQVGAIYTITATNSGTASTSGLVTVTDTLPVGLTATAINGGATWACVLGTLTCTRNTVLGAGLSYPAITLTVTVANNAPASVTNSVSVSGGGQTNTANDTATDPTTINHPDLTITKSHAGNFTQGQVGATYTITATNSGAAATNGSTVTVTDTLPAGLTATAISGSAPWVCVLGTLTCTRSDVLGAGASYSAITVTVNVANNAPASVTNSVSVAGGGQIITSNDTATDPTTINQLPDLTIVKSHVGNFTQGQVGATYTITATNSGFASTSGTVTVTDTLPAGLTATAISGGGWVCVLGTLTCTRNDVLLAGANYPAITLTVNVANNAAASVTNSVTVSGGGQTNTANDTANDATTINQLPDLTIVKSHVGNFTQGQAGATYTITATNSGFASTSGTATVTDTLPAGLTATAISGGGWVCVLGTLTCTRNDVLLAAASYPAITVTVTVANNAAASMTNTAAVSGGGQTNTANDTANDATTINQLPDLTIVKSHVGNFTQGQVGAAYTITATNSGSASTSGMVTVTDTLPVGLTATAISGASWVCVLGTLTCTRNDVLLAGASYPAITVTVTVANNAAASVTNSVAVSGGGQTNTANDTANNPTTINQLPDLTIVKSHVGNFTQGQVGATYTITATNSGFALTSGTVTVTDTLPVGLAATAISGGGWVCVLGTLTCTRSDALGAGLSYSAITVTVNVSLTAPASVTNAATVSGGGENNASNNTANDLTTINAAAPPNIGLVKSVSPGGTQSPGTDLLYTIVYTNTGGQPATTVIIIDPNVLNVDPLERVFHNVDFKVGSIASSPGTTGLIATFEYSNNGGATWTYSPVSGAGGAPAGYDRNVTNVRWRFAGSLSYLAPNNSGSVSFTVRIR